jgi:rare lipoprotein A
MKIVDNLRTTYKKKVAVQVKIVNGVKYYSIMLVGFTKRDKVEMLMAELKKKFPDSFVVDFSK